MSIKKNFIYNVIYQILLMILPLITTPYISRVIGVKGIGLYSYSYSIASYFTIFIMLGLNNYGNRTIAMAKESREELSRTFSGIYIMQLTCGLVLSAIYLLYSLFMASDHLLALIQFMYVLSAVLDINWFFFGLEQFKLTITRNIVIKLTTTGCIFLFINSDQDIYRYCLIMSAGILASQISIWPFVRRHAVLIKVAPSEVIQHFKPNIVLFIPVVAISLYKILDKIMLGILSNMNEVGYYECSEKLISIPVALINALGIVMLPRMSSLVSKGKKEETLNYIRISLIFASFISSALAFGICSVIREFVPLFYGNGYDRCIQLINILMIATIFLSWANVIRTQYLIPNKLDSIYIESVFLGAVVNIIINLFMIPYFRSTGAAIGTVCAESIVCIFQFCAVSKEIPIMKYCKESVAFLFIGAAMLVCLRLVPMPITDPLLLIVVKAIIGGVFYLSISWLYLKGMVSSTGLQNYSESFKRKIKTCYKRKK